MSDSLLPMGSLFKYRVISEPLNGSMLVEMGYSCVISPRETASKYRAAILQVGSLIGHAFVNITSQLQLISVRW